MGGGGNAAVMAVGRTFFRITIIGYTLSGLAMFPAVILGIRSGYFEWEMDRCNCATATSSTGSASSAASLQCVPGQDFGRVSIGWQQFTYDELKHTVGCPEAYALYESDPVALKEDLDDPQTFEVFDKHYPLDGIFQKTDNPTQADEDNGGDAAGGGVVAMQVILCFFSIFTYKMLMASYLSNGSHCSVGLGLMTRLNMLMGLGTGAAIVSFWWLIEGRFGDDDKALTRALEDVSTGTTPVSRRGSPVRVCVAKFLNVGLLWNLFKSSPLGRTLRLLCKAYDTIGIDYFSTAAAVFVYTYIFIRSSILVFSFLLFT